MVGAFVATLVFGYLFRWTATARAVRPMLERRTPPTSIEFSLIKKVPKTVRLSIFFKNPSQVFFYLGMKIRKTLWDSEVFIFLSGIAAIWGVVFPFEVIGDDMLQREFGYSADNGGFIIALAPMVSILSPALVPFLGSTLHQKLAAFRNLPWIHHSQFSGSI